MSFFAYRWSIRSVVDYLSSHGRGNFPEENEKIIAVDVLTRVVWVLVFAFVFGIVGSMFVPNWASRFGFILADICFLLLMIHIELCFMIHIGRLESLDTEAKVAYFTEIGSNKVFDHIYDEDGEDLLREKMKYLVADYGIFSMYVAVDDYEWNGGG
jgi:hypothetical protein